MEGALRHVYEAGGTASVVAGDPINQAVLGGRGMVASGLAFEQQRGTSRERLAVSNLHAFSDHVESLVDGLLG